MDTRRIPIMGMYANVWLAEFTVPGIGMFIPKNVPMTVTGMDNVNRIVKKLRI